MKASPPQRPSLKGPLARDETAVPTPRRVIPDGCNMGVLLRVIGTIVVLALMAAVGESSSPIDALTALLRLMSFLAPTT